MARIWTEREAYRIPTTNTSNAGGTWNKCATISYAQGLGISCLGNSNLLISLDNMPVKNYYLLVEKIIYLLTIVYLEPLQVLRLVKK